MRLPLSHEALHPYPESLRQRQSLYPSLKTSRARCQWDIGQVIPLTACFSKERNSCALPACNSNDPSFWVRWRDGMDGNKETAGRR